VSFSRPSLLAAISLGLSACSALPAKDAPPGAQASRADQASVALSRPQESVRPAAPDVTVPTPDKLVGLTPVEMMDLVGTPDLRRKEAQAEMWQYVSGPCVLDVFLYEDKEGVARVAHTNLRTQNATKTPREACLGDMVRQKRS
jgi:hypothetical protein